MAIQARRNDPACNCPSRLAADLTDLGAIGQASGEGALATANIFIWSVLRLYGRDPLYRKLNVK